MSTPFSNMRGKHRRVEPAAQGEGTDPFFFGEAAEEPAAASGGLADTGLLIDMRNIVKTYNVGEPSELTVLHGVDFHAEQGEFVSIVGPSGGGKSTLMNLIGMLDRPTEGAYAFNGEPVYAKTDRELAAYRSGNIGFIFQNFNLIGRIDALQNVAMPMMYAGVDKKERDARAEELLGMMGMGDRIHHQPNELSGGQKQRVAIVRALMMQPRALLLDEITASLDPEIVREVLDVVVGLARDGMTMLVVTHEMSFARAVADRVAFMDAGRIVEIAPPEDFFAAPTTERAQRFLNQLVF